LTPKPSIPPHEETENTEEEQKRGRGNWVERGDSSRACATNSCSDGSSAHVRF
jgi:hypothetical protein